MKRNPAHQPDEPKAHAAGRAQASGRRSAKRTGKRSGKQSAGDAERGNGSAGVSAVDDLSPPPRTKHRAWLAAALVVITFAVYVNGFAGEFVLDSSVIPHQAAVHAPSLGALLGNDRPVLSLSLAINHALGGRDPWGYRLVNTLIHALAACVLFLLVDKTLRIAAAPPSASADVDGEDATRHHPSHLQSLTDSHSLIAFAIASLWAVHPLQTQAVTYVVQRAESLCGLFYLLSMFAAVQAATAGDRRRAATAWLLICGLALAAGFGVKQVIVTAPLAILLYDAVFLRWRFVRVVRRHMLLLIAVSLPAVYLLGRSTRWGAMLFDANLSAGFGYDGFSSWDYLRGQAGVLLYYLRLFAWPYPQSLDYGWLPPTETWRWLVPGLVVLAMLVLGVFGVRRRRAWGFLLLGFFLVLAPTSSIMPIADLLMEHRVYLSLACVIALLVLGVASFLRRGHARGVIPAKAACGVGVVLYVSLLAAFAARTIARNAEYRDPVGLWQQTLAINPDHGRALTNLGARLVNRGALDEAIPLLRHAVTKGQPAYGQSRIYLGQALMMKAQTLRDPAQRVAMLEEGWQWLKKAEADHADDAELQQALGDALLQRGQREQAVEHYAKAVKRSPTSDRHAFSHAWTLYELGRLGEARRALESAVVRIEGDLVLESALVLLLAESGEATLAHERFERTAKELERVRSRRGDAAPDRSVEVQSRWLRTHYQLGRAMLRLGDYEKAWAQLAFAATLAREFRPGFLDAEADLARCDALSPNGDHALALKVASQLAKRTQYRHLRSLQAFAAALAVNGRKDEAVRLQGRAIEIAKQMKQAPVFIRRMEQSLSAMQAPTPRP